MFKRTEVTYLKKMISCSHVNHENHRKGVYADQNIELHFYCIKIKFLVNVLSHVLPKFRSIR